MIHTESFSRSFEIVMSYWCASNLEKFYFTCEHGSAEDALYSLMRCGLIKKDEVEKWAMHEITPLQYLEGISHRDRLHYNGNLFFGY